MGLYQLTGSSGSTRKPPILPQLGGDLYAGWLLMGADHTAQYSAVIDDYRGDLSGNGRDLTLTGSGPGATATAMTLGPSNWLQAPFGLDDIFGAAGFTLIMVAASDSSGFVEIGVFDVTGGSGQGAAIAAVDNTDDLVGYNYPGGPQIGIQSASNRAAATFEFHAYAVSPSSGLLYRRRAGFGAAETASSSSTHAIANTGNLRIGRSIDDGPFAGVGSGALAMVADRALTLTELNTAYAQTKALLADSSVAI